MTVTSSVRGPAPSEYVLGIDLGTTSTTAAVCRTLGGKHVVSDVRLGARTPTMPTVMAVLPDGTVLVGDPAEEHAHRHPERAIRNVKRLVGDPAPLLGTIWTPERLLAHLVRRVVDTVTELESARPGRTVLAVPVSWGDDNLEVLSTALQGCGLTVTLVTDAEAAAAQYVAVDRRRAGQQVALYDFGGGFVRASVLQLGGPGLRATVLGPPEGSDRIGGTDVDDAVLRHLRAALPQAFLDRPDGDPAMRRTCTVAKEMLSSGGVAHIPVRTSVTSRSVTVHRADLEERIRPLVDDTIAMLDRAIESAGTAAGELSDVLLLGGSSRIPLVVQRLSACLGRPVALGPSFPGVVARGAALLGSGSPDPAGGVPASGRGLASAPSVLRFGGSHRRGQHPSVRSGPLRTSEQREVADQGKAEGRGSRPQHSGHTDIGVRSTRPTVALWSASPVGGRSTLLASARKHPWLVLVPVVVLVTSLGAAAAAAMEGAARGDRNLAATPSTVAAPRNDGLVAPLPPDPSLAPAPSAGAVGTSTLTTTVTPPTPRARVLARSGSAHRTRRASGHRVAVRPDSPTSVPASAVAPLPAVDGPTVTPTAPVTAPPVTAPPGTTLPVTTPPVTPVSATPTRTPRPPPVSTRESVTFTGTPGDLPAE